MRKEQMREVYGDNCMFCTQILSVEKYLSGIDCFKDDREDLNDERPDHSKSANSDELVQNYYDY